MVYKWLNSAHEWLLPSTCVLCGRRGEPGRDLCPGCSGDLPFLDNCCRRCALPLEGGASEGDGRLCGDCLTGAPSYDHVRALFHYQAPLDTLVQDLKFNGKLYNARLLGGLMADFLAQRIAAGDRRPDLIIPVPLHGRRLRERGFNQALELARPVAKRLNIPLDTKCCRRSRHTGAQSELGAVARRDNLKNAFELDAGRLRERGVRSVALVDDVMTTGTTIEYFSQEFKKTEIDQVVVWVLARAGRGF